MTRRTFLSAASVVPAAAAGVSTLAPAAPVAPPVPETVWIDDTNGSPPHGYDPDKVAPDGRIYRYTLACFLDGDADDVESGYAGVRPILVPRVAALIRSVAAECRAKGILTAEDYAAR